MIMPELAPMSLARPRIVNLSCTVCCRYRSGTFTWSELLTAAFRGTSAKAPKPCSVIHHVDRCISPHRERHFQRLYCNASRGPELEGQLVQDVNTHQRILVPDNFVDASLSPFAASAKRLRSLLADSDIWADVKTWVVFSDLHLSRRTSNTCLEVLRTVHSQASARNAGIIFLGDFWHARGALPVELLNLAIAELQTWTCPTIFIPGNHDQVSMGGEIHALTVLEATNYYIKVISEPTEYLGALWLPFRRDHDVIKDAVTRSSGAGAIFAHLDVIGASMNEQRQASDGVDPAMFPPTLPVFTGHYHKPHVVDNSRVEYIGSPYQISASESGQRKRFLLLNQKWDKLDEIPVDIGPRHYTFEDNAHNLPALQDLRNGDRVKWLLSTETLSTDVKRHVAKLRREGVHIELVYPTIAPKPRIEKAEDLDVFSLFRLYAKNANMNEGATNKAMDILHGLSLPANLIKRPQVHLVFKSVEIEGFGPFVEAVKYPLAQRGFRVVSGKVVDSMGADSNGAGKTTLVMAPLWAITGSTDPRPDSAKGLTAADVLNKRSKRARVQVEGTVNERPFMIERTTNSKKASLRFVVDGLDETCQEIKLTQERIDEFLNTDLLERAVFHGQHDVHGLLEANDKTFKEELSKVLALDIWLHAREKSKADLRDAGNKIQQIEGALGVLSECYNQLSNEVKLSKERVQDWENAQARKISRICLEVETARDILKNSLSESKYLCEQVENLIKEWAPFGNNLEPYVSPVSNCVESLNSTWKTIRFEERELLVRRSAELAVEVRNAQAAKQEKLATLEEFNNVTKTLVCNRCLQEIPPDHVSKHMRHFRSEVVNAGDMEAHLRHNKDETTKQLELLTEAINKERQLAEKALASRKEKTAKISARVQMVWEAIASAQLSVEKANMFISQHDLVPGEGCTAVRPNVDASPGTECNEAVLLDDTIERKLGHFKALVSELLSRVAMGEKDVQKLQIGQSDLEGARNEKNIFSAQYSSISEMHSNASNQLEQQLSSLEENRQSAQWLKEVDAAFGHSGIQSYVLEGAVAELQERTSRFVQALSGGTLGLLLNSTKQHKTKKGSTDNIEKIPLKRMEDGSLEQWSLAQLSGGERRRLALGLELGYAELAAERGGLHSDLLVVDEVMQHLDSEGKARALSVLRGLPHGTILIVSQAHSDVAEGFDLVDVVVKQDHAATVELAEGL